MSLEEENIELSTEFQKKRKLPIEKISEDLNEILLLVTDQIEKQRKSLEKNKGTRTLKSVKKKIEHALIYFPALEKKFRPVKRDTSKSGFVVPFNISEELSDFLEIDSTSKLSRSDVQCALSAYIHLNDDEDREKILKWKYLNALNRDLRDVKCKRIIKPDDKLSKLLNYEKYKIDVSKGLIFINNKKLDKKVAVVDDNLQYYVVMKLIQPHFIKIKN